MLRIPSDPPNQIRHVKTIPANSLRDKTPRHLRADGRDAVSSQKVYFRLAGQSGPITPGEVVVYEDGHVALFDTTPSSWGVVTEWWME